MRTRFIVWLAKALRVGEARHLRHLSEPADGSYPRFTTFEPGPYFVIPIED